MKKLKCKICGKEIEGYNSNHVKFLMKQHQLKHDLMSCKEKKENESEHENLLENNK